MPFVSLSQKDLASSLNLCSQVSPKRHEIDVFTFTKVTISSDKIHLSAINSQTFFKVDLKFSSLEGLPETLNFLIKTEIFTQAVALISDEVVALDIDLAKHTLVVQGSKAKHSLRLDTDKLSEFLDQPDFGNIKTKLSIPANQFLQALKVANISVGQPKNVYEPKFLNICLTVRPAENQLVVVSTDRFRVTKTLLDVEIKETTELFSAENPNFLILPRGLQLLNGFSLNDKSAFDVSFFENLAEFQFGENKIVLRYGEGNYPDYEKIIPQSFTCNFELETKEFLTVLRQVYLSARANTVNKSLTVEIKPAENLLVLNSKAEDGYSSEATLSIYDYQGTQEKWSQAFNADYLIDYISTVATDKILWEANPGKPSVLSPAKEDKRQIYLVIGLK